MTTNPPTSVDFHQANTLIDFLIVANITLPARELGNWRRVPVNDRCLTHLRGQPHQGQGVPEITNGVLTYWRSVPSQQLLLVSAFNVIQSKLNLTGLKPGRKPSAPRQRRAPLLSDFC